jgi:hypothetical protein
MTLNIDFLAGYLFGLFVYFCMDAFHLFKRGEL